MCNFLASNAAEFLREMARGDRPFVLYITMFEPHPPYNGPLNDLYNPESIPDGPLFLKKPADNCSMFNRLRAEENLADSELKSPSDWRILRARYYGNVTLMDSAVGKVIDALEETGLADNTAIVFTSDHGDSLGDRGMLGKRAFYEEVAKVPLLMRVPWLNSEQKRISGSFGHVDLIPTLLDLLVQHGINSSIV